MKAFDEKNMEAVVSPVNPNHPEPLIHRLPVELLQVIFLLIVNDVPDCPSIFSSRKTTMSANFYSPPLLFTRVCRHWRVVAHSTTDIWSRIKVKLPGWIIKSKSSLPSLLHFWLALSGNRPLSLRIEDPRPVPNPHHSKCKRRWQPEGFSEADRRLLEILLAEQWRWETVSMSCICSDGDIFVTPQLKTLECHWSDVKRFHAPDLCRLHIIDPWLDPIQSIPALTCRNIHYLHFRDASPNFIHCTSVIFPHLKTIVVDSLLSSDDDAKRGPATHSCLESITLPIRGYYGDLDTDVIDVFRGSHLPVLQKLTFTMGKQQQEEVDFIMAALAATASCNVKAVDLQTVDEVDGDTIKPLLSVVGEVTVRGQVICSGLT
ncbi:hypothetical protein DFH29DRAFT_955366 [Suillus ampliporus]|nr:hypothetical protein DFH29DRAFT_955366 [Suillus ampliporus]